ncbi:MAG: ABC transporter ATP-binding protein [Candidatus Nitrotoga sp.]
MSEYITLSAHNLHHHRGQREIIRDVSLELKRGEVLGLLGHNGAGKSTTLQALAGALQIDSGRIEICGFNLKQHAQEAKSRIGFLPEMPPLYQDMRVDDYLIYCARLHRMQPADIAAALIQTKQHCGLQDYGAYIIGTLSKGYQQRVGIAQALIHQPQVIILDEPTVGLDPTQIKEIRMLIRELGDAHSVILSTHLLSEVENICDRVEILHHGRLIYSDSSAGMQQHGQQPGFIVSLLTPPEISVLRAINMVTQVEQLSPTQFKILHTHAINSGDTAAAALLTLAAQHGWQAQQLVPLKAKLEDVFNQLTQDS